MDALPTFAEMEENGVSITQGVYASKLGRWNDTLFISSPIKLFSAPEGYLVSSYDAHLNDLNLTVAATISNVNSGAVIVEETGLFENRIESSEATFKTRELSVGLLPVSFTVTNKGYQPVTSIEVDVQGEKQIVDVNLLPEESTLIEIPYFVTTDFDGNITYDITAGFTSADNSLRASQLRSGSGLQKIAANVNNDATVVDMALDLLSNATNKTAATLMFKVRNNSPFKLNPALEVEVGLYKDAEGKELYEGTSVQTIPAAGLYDTEVGTNLNHTAIFTVPNVLETEVAYVRVRTLNGTTEIKDRKTIDNLLPVHIYPQAKPLAAPVILTTALPEGTEGNKYEENLQVESELSVTWSWEATTGSQLPAGLTLDTSTGAISGTPLEGGEYIFTVTATNDAGSDRKTITLVVTKETGIDSIAEERVELFPNPVSNILYLRHNFDTLEKIAIIDLEGKSRLHYDNFIEKSIDVSFLNSGVYFIKLTINGQSVVHKFIKK